MHHASTPRRNGAANDRSTLGARATGNGRDSQWNANGVGETVRCPHVVHANGARRSRLAVRWTIGEVHPLGFDSLRLSTWGAWNLFGSEAAYTVCVNSIGLSEAQRRTGPVPDVVSWRENTHDLPAFIQRQLAPNMAEGVGWKLAPPQLFPSRFELSLDNDCILWSIPPAMQQWLQSDGTRERTLIASDTRRMLGKFEDLCGPGPRNSGIRGLPPEFDFEQRLRHMLATRPVVIDSELDEQGLQVAAIGHDAECLVVESSEVTICSPFPDHSPHLGSCGAHFVGLNAHHLPWEWQGRPASEWTREHFLRLRDEIAVRVRAPGSAGGDP